jgi:putative hydrolase of HD superfamily
MSFNRRDIEFLYEVGTLRNVQRHWRQTLGVDCANDLEHTMRVVWLALIIARKEGVKDEEKVMKMALVHDLPETRTGDPHYVNKAYVETDADGAAKDMFAGTSLGDFYDTVLAEYMRRRSKVSKIVKDADNLDIDLELKELEERGSKLPKKWREFRRVMRNKKLYTKSAKKLWDTLDKVDVSAWHLKFKNRLAGPKMWR